MESEKLKLLEPWLNPDFDKRKTAEEDIKRTFSEMLEMYCGPAWHDAKPSLELKEDGICMFRFKDQSMEWSQFAEVVVASESKKIPGKRPFNYGNSKGAQAVRALFDTWRKPFVENAEQKLVRPYIKQQLPLYAEKTLDIPGLKIEWDERAECLMLKCSLTGDLPLKKVFANDVYNAVLSGRFPAPAEKQEQLEVLEERVKQYLEDELPTSRSRWGMTMQGRMNHDLKEIQKFPSSCTVALNKQKSIYEACSTTTGSPNLLLYEAVDMLDDRFKLTFTGHDQTGCILYVETALAKIVCREENIEEYETDCGKKLLLMSLREFKEAADYAESLIDKCPCRIQKVKGPGLMEGNAVLRITGSSLGKQEDDVRFVSPSWFEHPEGWKKGIKMFFEDCEDVFRLSPRSPRNQTIMVGDEESESAGIGPAKGESDAREENQVKVKAVIEKAQYASSMERPELPAQIKKEDLEMAILEAVRAGYSCSTATIGKVLTGEEYQGRATFPNSVVGAFKGCSRQVIHHNIWDLYRRGVLNITSETYRGTNFDAVHPTTITHAVLNEVLHLSELQEEHPNMDAVNEVVIERLKDTIMHIIPCYGKTCSVPLIGKVLAGISTESQYQGPQWTRNLFAGVMTKEEIEDVIMSMVKDGKLEMSMAEWNGYRFPVVALPGRIDNQIKPEEEDDDDDDLESRETYLDEDEDLIAEA